MFLGGKVFFFQQQMNISHIEIVKCLILELKRNNVATQMFINKQATNSESHCVVYEDNVNKLMK